MRKTYQITEYGSFISGKQVDGYSTLPEKTFEQLENFVLSNRNKETDALELLSLSAKKGLGKVITAKNYAAAFETRLRDMIDEDNAFASKEKPSDSE